MKLSEVIADMENGSTKTYEATTVTGTKIKMQKTFLRLDLDWKPVREPVTWQKALQAWVDGKTIRLKMPEWEQVWKPTNAISFNHCQITHGTWYVED